MPFAPVPFYRDLLDAAYQRILVMEPSLAAVRDTLPASAADRVKAMYPNTQELQYVGALQRQVGDLLSEDHRALEFFDRTALRTAVQREAGALVPDERRAFEFVLDLAVWLDAYRPTIKLS